LKGGAALRAIVCIKHVPDTAELPKVTPESVAGGSIQVTMVVNPWDEYAIEEALLLKEAHGGSISALSLGGPAASEALKTAVAMGADEAVLLSDKRFGSGDAGTISYTLAKAVSQLGEYDLILCGKESVDGNSGLTAAMLSRHLGIPHMSNVIKIRAIDFDACRITVERLVEEGLEIVSSPLPAVVSVIKGINEPRYPSFRGIRTAARMDIPVWGIDDISDLDVTRAGSDAATVHWSNLRKPPARSAQCEIIEADSTAELAAKLADRLLEATGA
jgi:electron transfer flavoprotein beta subunit